MNRFLGLLPTDVRHVILNSCSPILTDFLAEGMETCRIKAS
jgi:hypothetical protein